MRRQVCLSGRSRLGRNRRGAATCCPARRCARGRRRGPLRVGLPDGEVAERDDADHPLVAIEDDEAADLVFFHDLARFAGDLVFEARSGCRR